MQAPEQRRVRWRLLVFAIIAFVVAVVALAFVAILNLNASTNTGPGGPYVGAPALSLAQLAGTAVTVISTLSGLVSIVRFLLDILHVRRGYSAQPVAADRARNKT
jgi:hypothetical protein